MYSQILIRIHTTGQFHEILLRQIRIANMYSRTCAGKTGNSHHALLQLPFETFHQNFKNFYFTIFPTVLNITK